MVANYLYILIWLISLVTILGCPPKHTFSLTHCPKNNLNLRIKAKPVTAGVDATEYYTE